MLKYSCTKAPIFFAFTRSCCLLIPEIGNILLPIGHDFLPLLQLPKELWCSTLSRAVLEMKDYTKRASRQHSSSSKSYAAIPLTFFYTIFLGPLVVWVLVLRGDALGALLVVVL